MNDQKSLAAYLTELHAYRNVVQHRLRYRQFARTDVLPTKDMRDVTLQGTYQALAEQLMDM